MIDKAHDNLLQLFRLHLPVTDGYAAIGYVFPDDIGNMVQSLDVIVDKEDLTVARHLKVDGISNDFAAELCQFRLYGIAVGRRSAHDAHVACPHQ